LPGKTQPVPGRRAIIAPVVLHPVEEVRVKVGDRVKKEQVLVKIDSDEPEADLRARKANVEELKASLARLQAEPREEDQNEAQANLETARVTAREAKELLERLEPVWRRGSVSDQRYFEARAAVLKAQTDVQAATARLTRLKKRPFDHEVAELKGRVAAAEAAVRAAEAELEHYEVKAMIDGVVTRLDAHPGSSDRPGTTVWGEILDLGEIDVRCDVAPGRADQITLGQVAEVLQDGSAKARPGKVVLVSIAADPKTGKVPVLIRLENTEHPLRCYVDVKVRFAEPPRSQK
jgi:multidrug resistance efflux pump